MSPGRWEHKCRELVNERPAPRPGTVIFAKVVLLASLLRYDVTSDYVPVE
jgi:hypothetical protein